MRERKSVCRFRLVREEATTCNAHLSVGSQDASSFGGKVSLPEDYPDGSWQIMGR